MNVKPENPKALKPMPVAELKQLHTGSLLERLKQLRNLQVSYYASDWLREELDAVEAAGLIAFKETDLWREAFDDVKGILAEREHLPRGSKQKRQQAARQKQNR
ncbi:hypothetical protein [Hoeflea alexandrii]|uniref:hypothetical protein n=1 Tax=Hoeflea alexandrii TaxID=288436 RepID=UPI0022AEAA3A|nr:hypothetical protein [Hoeflea alexandrii]MCZ4287843.1 hypothetical protein [Hoeflea alexandrii]